jgi:hypothetical protein
VPVDTFFSCSAPDRPLSVRLAAAFWTRLVAFITRRLNLGRFRTTVESDQQAAFWAKNAEDIIFCPA